MVLGLRLLFNLKVYTYAKENFPEFSGYKSRTFPGQEPPRKLQIFPRRNEVPDEFENEGTEFGSKHGKTILINVKSATLKHKR